MYIVFVATEIDPILPGGAGTVVAELTRRLTGAGHRVEILVVAAAPENVADHDLPVTWVAPGVPDWRAPDQHIANSRAAAEAVAGLPEQPDLVEFQDFQGLGVWALMRRGELGLTDTPLVIRAHGPIGLIVHGVAPDHQPLTRTVERQAFQMADAVVASSVALADVLVRHYDLDRDRVRIGEPPVPALVLADRRPAEAPEIVSYGRLGARKGSEDLLHAALPLLAADSQAVLRFVGHDGWRIDTGKSMAAYLRSLIPEHLADQVRFEDPVNRGELASVLASAWMVVFPSRFETFSLAVHECRQLGVPIVIPQIPAYRGYFGYRSGARLYDGSVTGLTEAMAELIDHPEMRAAMEAATPPPYGDPLLPYRPLTPRHPRTQAGLATAALRRIEAVSRPQPPTSPAASRLADRVLDGLPESLAGRLEVRAPGWSAVRRWRRRRAAAAWERD
ncbi:MAG: glycosyltransferase family 4 protein, partial [Acidimicrobiia bacterium]|nr:glycosyltransferase family 4 protein [Acidimicrobiia bacterium]